MNKTAIWVIIGLMSAAIIGIVLLQLYWITSAVNLNEEKFDKNVYDALNKVAAKVEFDKALNIETSSVSIFQEKDFIIEGECNCHNCRVKRKRYYQEIVLFKELIKMPEALENRIDLKSLNLFIEQELKNLGISMVHEHGVFSNKDKCFVIVNDSYVVCDETSQNVTASFGGLSKSKYKVQLFSKELNPPGYLFIHFPGKIGYVWSTVWKTLLSSILLTGIILFCFLYTISVIFRQKKLGEMKNDFINNMTHEFKTPIATISLAADSITSPMISGNVEKVARFANIIKQENKRMNNQVEKVLQMAVLDKQDFELRLTDIDLNQVVRQAVGNLSLQVEKKGGTVIAILEAESPTIQGDLTHVTNIIHNLLDNANKYSANEPAISISTKNIASGVQVTVKDQGIGMSTEARKHIFDKFYRVHTGNRHDVKGFGLGLSYVKAIMDAHKGEVAVESELGKGSSFILFFPFTVVGE